MKSENWMKWDIASLESQKTKWFLLGFENKDQALGTFLRLVTRLYQKADHWLTLDDMFYDTYCAESGTERKHVEAAIARLISAKLFTSRQRDSFVDIASLRVLEEIEKREAISKARAEAGKQGAETTNKKRQVPSKKRQRAAKRPRLDKIREDRDISSILTESPGVIDPGAKYEVFRPEDFSLPPRWGEQSKQALEDWVSYKAAAGHAKRLVSYQHEVKIYEDRPKIFVALVRRAIAGGWQGLNEEIALATTDAPPTRSANQERKSQALINEERTLQAVENILRRQGYDS